MQTPPSLLPGTKTLVSRLRSAMNLADRESLRLLERKRPRYMSTFPNEIIVCSTGRGEARELFVKYEAGRDHGSYGHRGGLKYESQVYRKVLQLIESFKPEFIGAHTDRSQGAMLVLEHLSRCTRLKDIRVRRKGISQAVAMVEAAKWIGRFHGALQPRVSENALSFLRSYDADYYQGWVDRAWEFSRPLHKRFPWLRVLCRESRGMFRPLLNAQRTVIHGEFYINNILVRRRTIHPIDWESAAVAPGEIDLAALTEGPWRTQLIERCERAYKQTRWPDGVPASFDRVLAAARLYLLFRWLGDCPEWTLREQTIWRYHHLHRLTEQLGLI